MGRASQSDVQRRRCAIVLAIPRGEERALSRAALAKALEPDDRASDRTLQRDLEELAIVHGGNLLCTRERVPRWYWREDAPAPAGVPMTPAQALALSVLREHFTKGLPTPTLADLEPFFAAAERSLKKNVIHARWTKKIRVIGLGFRPSPPFIPPGIAETITRALLDERRCAFRYLPAKGKGEVDYNVDPLGLLIRDDTVTLLAAKIPSEEIREFHLHRMSSATVREDVRRVPKTFDFEAYDPGGGPAVPGPERLRVKMLLERGTPMFPRERPLDEDDQVLTRAPDGRDVVEATVPNSLEFVAWLRGFGPQVEVVEPPELRAKMREEAHRAARIYDAPPGVGAPKSGVME